MRISGGDSKGIRLKVPAGARPASERVRQAVFSSLAAHVPDARILDLYCGSGAYGLEALSRGARSGVFVDSDPQAVAACRANAAATGYADFTSVRLSTAERYVSGRGSRDGPFDLVFVDPPYGAADEAEPLLGALVPLLAQGARIVLEARKSDSAPPAPTGLLVEADRRYGDTRVLVFLLGEP